MREPSGERDSVAVLRTESLAPGHTQCAINILSSFLPVGGHGGSEQVRLH